MLKLLADPRAIVLLPTHDAVAALQAEFDRCQRERGLHAWEPAPLFSWDRWLVSLWDDLAVEGFETRILLNRLQEEVLWARLAPSAGVQGASAANTQDLARQARSALVLASAYCAVGQFEASADSSDSRVFAAWHQLFTTHCRREHLLPRASLTAALCVHLAESRIPAVHQLHMIGFDNLEPVQTRLLEELRLVGTTVLEHRLHRTPETEARAACVLGADPEAELRWGVRWLGQQFMRHLGENGPGSPAIAMILPDPEAERAVLEPLLREYLAPELEAITADLSSAPWRFNTGAALAKVPMVQHALHLLQWLHGELSTERIGALLLSPYLQHTDDFEQRARFELYFLRKRSPLRPEMGFANFLRWAETANRHQRVADAAVTLPEWHNLHALLHRKTRQLASYGEWTEHTRHLLKVAGWPGERPLSASEFRVTEAWDGVLDLLATLDLHGSRVTLQEFLGRLTDELQHVTLQPSQTGAGLHILRAAEAEGRFFDATLVLRATDGHWPAAEKTHPFLGWALQRSLHMPGTDTAAAQERGRRTLQSLGERSGSLLLVTAAHDASGPLRLTFLTEAAACLIVDPETLLPPETALPSLAYEEIPDLSPLPPLPSAYVAGGARVLELQANCGFRAFASLRLGAEAPEITQLGFSPREAGTDLHKALETFWHAFPGRTVVQALSQNERQHAVTAAVREAMSARRSAVTDPDPWTEAYLQIAEQRLARLLVRWLEEELKRDDFIVTSQEQKQLVTIGPLQLNVRPDRIDAVEGGLVFVDYKTSLKLSTDDWLGDRPAAPQLPLYALLAGGDQVRGIAFGRVRAGEAMGWISLGADQGLFPPKGRTLTDDLGEQLVRWQTELARLAFDFANGAALVDPKSYPGTCEYCQQRLLCRLNPVDLLASASPAVDLQEEEENDPGR